MDRPVSTPDLFIVPDAVQATARRIEELSHEAEALVANRDLFTTDQVSHPDLADALQGFADEWNHQVRGGSVHFRSVAARLAEITQSYLDTDDKIAAALTRPSRPDGTA